MRILVLGDVVGRPGRKFVSDHLKTFIAKKIYPFVLPMEKMQPVVLVLLQRLHTN